MEIKFIQTGRKYEHVFSALFLAAVICNVFAALDAPRLLPWALVGTIILLAAPVIPGERKRLVFLGMGGILAAFALIRFAAIADGVKLLANRMFWLSEQSQSYEYDYFQTTGASAAEAVLWLSVLAGSLCALWGNRANAALCAGWIIAMAYFGVTPGAVWMAALLLAGCLSALPGQRRWFYGLIIGAVIVGIFLTLTRLAPEPNQTVSQLDERLRDALASASVAYEQTPVPTQVPEPELVPQSETQLEQPDHGVQGRIVNVLFLLLAALTLALLFIPAVIRDRAEKRRQDNRAGLGSEDTCEAVRAMYLYTRKWRKLAETPVEIPREIREIWLEAAYSDHPISRQQRDAMYGYMKDTAMRIWNQSGWKKRLDIRYRSAL